MKAQEVYKSCLKNPPFPPLTLLGIVWRLFAEKHGPVAQW